MRQELIAYVANSKDVTKLAKGFIGYCKSKHNLEILLPLDDNLQVITKIEEPQPEL